MAPDPTPSAALARIQERHEQAAPALAARRGLNSMADSAEDVPRLVKAVAAVLKLADEALPVDRDYGGEPIWWNLTPDDLREAITTALTETPKEGSDE